MRDQQSAAVLKDVRTLFEAGTAAALSDGELLERFAERGGESAEIAFAALVGRHGPMVLRVCRTLLGNTPDAQDAFQATFLVLARRSDSIRRRDSLGSWLHGVARRIALEARSTRARQERHERRYAERAPSPILEESGDRQDLASSLHEELGRLPERYRSPLILCGLGGLTHDEAARQLGWPIGTVKSRLARGKDELRSRLTRRGLTPSAVLFPLWREGQTIPVGLVDTTARAAAQLGVGRVVAGSLPSAVLGLVQRAGRVVSWSSSAWILGCGLAILAVGFGVGLGGDKSVTHEPASPPPNAKVQRPVAAAPAPASPTLRERYEALVKRYEQAKAAGVELQRNAANDEERTRAFLAWSKVEIEQYFPEFLALAEESPEDPVAMEALSRIIEGGANGYDSYPTRIAVFRRTLDRLVEDHLADPKLGRLCAGMTRYPSPLRDRFLRKVAESSPNRQVAGQASFAFAEYLKMKGAFVESLGKPPTDPGHERSFLEMYGREYSDQLRRDDYRALLRESGALFTWVQEQYGDLPYARPDGRATRETLADAARAGQTPGPTIEPEERFNVLRNAYQKAKWECEQAEKKGKSNEERFAIFLKSRPKWEEFGPKVLAIAVDYPRNPSVFEALDWILTTNPYSPEAEPAAKRLIHEFLDDERMAALCQRMVEAPGSPAAEALLRGAEELSPRRVVKGHAAFALARLLKRDADMARTFNNPLATLWTDIFEKVFGAEPVKRLRGADVGAFEREAESRLERVAEAFGDLSGIMTKGNYAGTMGEAARADLLEMRRLGVGQPAPEIAGEDVEGKPMTLGEYRGKVVVLNFNSHEFCGACRDLYPKERALVERMKGRPFALLGINSDDNRELVREVIARGEITWRSWWDGPGSNGGGPICRAWNIDGYPTFYVLDHRGVIRSKRDVQPYQTSFDELLERLVKEAEAERK